MTDKCAPETGDQFIFEALEPRLLLSAAEAWPVIGEIEPHSSNEAAQNVTAELVELFAGEGSYGVVIEGHTDGESDYYLLDGALSGWVRAVVEPLTPGEGDQLRGYLSSAGFDWSKGGTVYDGSSLDAYLEDGGQSYISVRSLNSTAIDYRITLSITEPRSAEFINPSYAPEKLVWESSITLEQGDPAEVFMVPGLTGNLNAEFDPEAVVTSRMAGYYPNLPDDMSLLTIAPNAWYDAETSGHVYLYRSGAGDLAEPNDTPAEAIDITDQLRDAPAWHEFADKIIHIETTRQDGTADWYKVTLDDFYIERGDDLRDINGDTVRGILAPGTYYCQATGSYGSGKILLELQEYDDGGASFVEIAPGIWKATVYPDYPDEHVLTIPLPADGNVVLVGPYVRRYIPSYGNVDILDDYYKPDPGYAYVKPGSALSPENNPVDIYAYEITAEIGESTTTGSATDVAFRPAWGNPDFLVGFPQADRAVGQKDYFRITVPWTANITWDPNHSNGGRIYDVTGTLVEPGVVDPGEYYMLFDAYNYDRQELCGVSLHRVLDVRGGATIAAATDLDAYLSATPGGRYLSATVREESTWYSFTAQQGENVSLYYIYDADGTEMIMYSRLIPADGRYYLSAEFLSKVGSFIIDTPRDITASVVASLADDGAWVSGAETISQGHHSSYNILQFTLDEPTAFFTGKLYDSTGRERAAGMLDPGTYWVRLGDSVPEVNLQALGDPLDLNALLVEIEPGRWRTTTDSFTVGLATLTIGEGQMFNLTRYGGHGVTEVRDSQGRVVPRTPIGYDMYLVTPDVYTIFAQSRLGETSYLILEVNQKSEAVFTPMAIGDDILQMEYDSGSWSYFRASGPGSIYSTGNVFLPATGYKWSSASFNAGDFVWAQGAERIVDYSPRADIGVTNDTLAGAVDVSSRWRAEPEGAEILFLRGRFDNTTGEDWYRIDMAAGDCIFSDRAAPASNSYVTLDAFDADGNTTPWRWVVASEPTTYFFRVTTSVPAGDNGYGLHLHRVPNARKGGSSYGDNTPLDDLYVPGEDLEFIAISGRFGIEALTTDVGYWYDLFPVTSILWNNDPSYTGSPAYPAGSSTYFDVSSRVGPARMVIHFYVTDEVESNETIELAQDMTDLLVQDGDIQTAHFTGAAGKDDEDWFKFQIDDYSTVSIERHVPEFVREGGYYQMPSVEIYDVSGIWIADTLDEHVPPGEFYVRVQPPTSSGHDSPVMYEFTVTISPGTPGAGDGNDTKETATSLNHLLDGQFHTIEDMISRTSDVDWFVFEPEETPYVVSAKRTTGHLALDVYYEYGGQLFLHTDANYSSSVYPPYVVDTAPLYLRASLVSGLPSDAGVIEIEQVMAPIVEFAPSEIDPNVSTFHTNENIAAGMFLLPAGSVLQADYYGYYRIRCAQPLEFMGSRPTEQSTVLAYRDMYVYFTYSEGSSNARLDMTITQSRKIEISDMVNLGAPGQGHYEFSIDVSESGRQYFHLDHPAGTTSTFDNSGPWRTLDPQWPSLAHIVHVDISATGERKVEGELWFSDESEPNDDLASAQRIDAMWRPWMATGQQLDLYGWISEEENDPADNFVFHLDAGEAIYLDPNRSCGGVFSGDGLVDNGAGVYLAVESGDVYLTGLAGENFNSDEYRIAIYRGLGAPANTEFSDAYDITAELAAGNVTLVTNAKYVTFLCEPGRLYATSMAASIYSETGETIIYPEYSSPALFSCDNRDQVVVHIGGDAYHVIRGDIMDVTERIVDLDSLFVPDPGQNTRSLSTILAPGDYISFTADPNEVLAWGIVSDIPDKPYGVSEPRADIVRADGERAVRMSSSDPDSSAQLGGGGRVYGSVQGYGNLTLTMTLTDTEPIANNSSATATNITDQLAPCDPSWYHSNAGEHAYAVYEGVISSSDSSDWISVDLLPDQYVTVIISTIRYGSSEWSYPPNCLISATPEGGTLAGSRDDNNSKRPYSSMSKIAHEAKTQRIKISRTYDMSIHYRVTLSVRDVIPFVTEDFGDGDLYGELDTEVRERSSEWDGQIYRVDIPADSIMTSSGAKKLIDVNNNRISGTEVATTAPETVYMALWPSKFWDSSNHEHGTLVVDIHPLWSIIPDVVQTIDYTLGDIEQLQGAFTGQQETWWQFTATAGRIVTLGRPDGAALAEQTDLFLIHSSNLARPWNITPDEDPALFDSARRYQTLQGGTYYVMAKPGVLSDGQNYDWQLLVQVAGDIEPNDTRPTATNLNNLFDVDANDRATVSLTGTFEDTADHDWYLATVDAGDFLYADITWEGGYWSNLPLEIYGPDGLLIWSDSEKGGVDRMIYAAQGGNYWIRTIGVGMAYSLDVIHGDTTPAALAEGQQQIDPPAGYDLWMARLDLPDSTALNTNWRHMQDSAGHLIDASVADWIGLPHADSYYIACYNGPLDADVRFADANVADTDNHTAANAESLDALFAVPSGKSAAEAYVLGLYGQVGTSDYYKVSLAAGEALSGGAIGHLEWDSVQRRWVNTYLEMKITWDGAEMAFPKNSAFVADHAGQAVISVRSLIEWDEYRLGLVKMAPGDVGDHAGPELIGGSMGRTEMDLAMGYGANADGPMTIYDADYNFVGRIESGSWYAPRDGRYHMFSATTPTAVDPQLRPRQVVYVNFAGGLVGQIPELFVDMGTLAPFDAGRFDLAAQQAQLQESIVTKLREMFADLDIEFVLVRPESLPFSKLYYTDSTLGGQLGLAMPDGVNADLFDDGYVFAGNILKPGHGLDGVMFLNPTQRSEVLATALANVGAAQIARLLGALPLDDTGALMALEQWDDLSSTLAFSTVKKSVRGMAILQNVAYAIGQGLDAHTPGVRIELGDNDTPANATIINIDPADDHGPTLLGGLTPNDTDFFSFELTESNYITWSISSSLGSIHMRLLDADLNLVLDDVDRDGRISGILDAGLYYIQLTVDALPAPAPAPATASAAAAPAPAGAPVPPESIDYTLSMAPLPGEASVAARHVFYNNSSFDGNQPAANSSDDNAIAPGKQALLAGESAAFSNYTSYNRGINGIMIDIADLANTPAASDFVFRTGNDSNPGGWGLAPAPVHIEVRSGAGAEASDRVTLTWVDNNFDGVLDASEAVAGQWLQVTVLSNANGGNMGLTEDDVFYFGNSIGEMGDSDTHTFVDGTDFVGVRDNPTSFPNRAAVTNAYDVNRDSFVDGTDLVLVRDNNTNFLTALKLILPPDSSPAPSAQTTGALAAASPRIQQSSGLSDELPLTLPGMPVVEVESVLKDAERQPLSAVSTGPSQVDLLVAMRSNEGVSESQLFEGLDTDETLAVDLLAEFDPEALLTI
jgi:hypothetical protein